MQCCLYNYSFWFVLLTRRRLPQNAALAPNVKIQIFLALNLSWRTWEYLSWRTGEHLSWRTSDYLHVFHLFHVLHVLQSPCCPCSPNLLHVLPSGMAGWNNFCSPEREDVFLPWVETELLFFGQLYRWSQPHEEKRFKYNECNFTFVKLTSLNTHMEK